MKFLLACDMEGISGVVDWEHVTPGHREYERFRKIMTGDVNSAIRGAVEAGAEEILVTDGHEDGLNILIEELDPRARLNCGSPSPLSIVQGAETGVDAALFVGFHARFGSEDAILCHTWSGVTRNLWLNDILVGETGLCAAVCGHFGVPVIFISGDDKVCTEAAALIGPLETAIVKRSLGRKSAECLSLEDSRQIIQKAAFRAVKRYQKHETPGVFNLSSPVKVIVELRESRMVKPAVKKAGIQKLDGNRISYQSENVIDAFRMFREINNISFE